jgi:hypothetical protein
MPLHISRTGELILKHHSIVVPNNNAVDSLYLLDKNINLDKIITFTTETVSKHL